MTFNISANNCYKFSNLAIYNSGRIKQSARDLNVGYFRVNLQASSQQPASLSSKPTRPLTPNGITMAAFFKAVNAKIRANPMLSYVCSTRTFTSQSDFPRFDSYSLDSG
jgi:hypothetical protein